MTNPPGTSTPPTTTGATKAGATTTGATTTGALGRAVLATLALGVAKLAAGLFTGSTAVVASGLDSLADAVMSSANLWLARVAASPPDADHPYGHHKAEPLAALAQVTLLSAIVVGVGWSAVNRLLSGEVPLPLTLPAMGMTVVAMASAWGISVGLSRAATRTGSLVLRTDAVHYRMDVWTGAAVLVGLIAAGVLHSGIPDAVAAIVVCLVMGRDLFKITREAISELMDQAMDRDERAVLIRVLEGLGPPVVAWHDLRSRRSGPRRFVQVHLEMPAHLPLAEAHRAADAAEGALRAAVPGVEALVHVDVDGERDHGDGGEAAEDVGLLAGAWWTVPAGQLVARLRPGGTLSSEEVERRLGVVGANRAAPDAADSAGRQLLAQLAQPLILLLAGAAAVSAVVGEWLDACVIFAIVLASAGLGFYQERRATAAVAKLRLRIRATARVERDGGVIVVPAEGLVPGDLVRLSAGAIVPADGVIVAAEALQVDQAPLTGETFPVEKVVGVCGADTPLALRANAVWAGTTVRSGSGTLLVITTGARTQVGAITQALERGTEVGSFELGMRSFGLLITRAMGALIVGVVLVNAVAGRPFLESLLFGIALAVGLAPELLPAILTVNLAMGARRMAAEGVLVRRLGAIEELGSMDVLCTDKTGTLTEGVVALAEAVDVAGVSSERVQALAGCNAALQRGMASALDEALSAAIPADPRWVRVGEVPYDFERRRLSVIVAGFDPGSAGDDGSVRLITKGAVAEVLAICTTVGGVALDVARRGGVEERVIAWAGEGYRVLAVASRPVWRQDGYGVGDEQGLDLEGFLLFTDPPKVGAAEMVAALARDGVTLKVVSGDNRHAVAHVARVVGLSGGLLTGAELAALDGDALAAAVEGASLFAEVDPVQKERVIRALRARGRTVGYLGDGVNDAPSLRAADVGLSVEGAVDVAREAAAIVLLQRDLGVLHRGVLLGRTIFANTLKYVLTTESANLGNMVSMAAASAFVPFLPLLPKQILLNNFLSDFPAFGLASDLVDPERVSRPVHWDVRGVWRFMLVFGAVSAVFDGMTFLVLLKGLHVDTATFRTAWFVESLLTELLVALCVRTERPAWASTPGRVLLGITAAVTAVALAAPYLPGASLFSFVPLEPRTVLVLVGITLAYLGAVEGTKRLYYRRARR